MADEAGTRTIRRRCTALTLTALLLAPSTAAADRLRTIDVATGTSAILASSPNLEWLDRPCWAPDGRVVALEYRSTRWSLQRRYVAYGPSGGRSILGNASRFTTDAALAPGCARVAERRRRMPLGGRGVMVRGIDGAAPAELTGRAGALAELAWSPDGGRLAGASTEHPFPTLRVVEAAGGREVPTELLAFARVHPGAFSPDGGRVAIVTGDPRTDFAEIAIVDLATGVSRSFGSDLTPEWVAWSPRGDLLAIVSGWGAIHLLDANDGRELGVVAPGTRANRIAWSPDGSQIAFSTFRRSGTSHYVVAARPGAPHRLLLATRALGSTALAWSPDGARIAVGGG